ncbi:MAG: hypothetical protein RMK97_04615 [Sutterellaceae bacterium]|nr:hypothetical protein [Burkholderiaceae bacterium]MDW8429775.1 hypothetical protein [Sutterellaceae bacterium]
MRALLVPLLLNVLLAAAPQAAAEPLGTLILSPAQRRALELQRRGSAAGSETPAAAPVRIDGVVVSRAGGVVAWVDGKAVLSGQRLDQHRIEATAEGVRIVSAGGAEIQVPVGARVDLQARRVEQPALLRRGSEARR